MYNEKTFKNYIFWTKVRRVFLMILFSVIGCLIGKFISSIIATVTTNNSYEVLIVSISTLTFFALSLLLTIGTAREVQDAYWKMAVLRKLSTMSKRIELLNNQKKSPPVSEKEFEDIRTEIFDIKKKKNSSDNSNSNSLALSESAPKSMIKKTNMKKKNTSKKVKVDSNVS